MDFWIAEIFTDSPRARLPRGPGVRMVPAMSAFLKDRDA